MKADLFSSIALAVVGVLISYFVCNLFFNKIDNYNVKIISSDVSTELVDPNPEVFNYKSLNPTVEVYVGNCTEYDSNGECINEPDSSTRKDL